MKNLTINNRCGEKLAAYLFTPPEKAQYMMVICHGFRGAKENGGKIFAFAEKLQNLGLGVLAFDFSGSGKSDGDFSKITLSHQADDLHHVIDYVYSQFSLPVILLGRSFGGSTVLAGGGDDPRVAGYILWSTPVFMQQTFATILPEEYKLLQQGNEVRIKDEAGDYSLRPELILDFCQHDMDIYIKKIGPRPTLIVHASDDEAVEPANAFYMRERLENCSLNMVDDAGHRFLDKIALREAITIAWLKYNFY